MKKNLMYVVLGISLLAAVYFWQKRKDERILGEASFTSGRFVDYVDGSTVITAPKIGVNKTGARAMAKFVYEVNGDSIISEQLAGRGLSYLGSAKSTDLTADYLVVYNKTNPDESRILILMPMDKILRGMSNEELLDLVKERYGLTED